LKNKRGHKPKCIESQSEPWFYVLGYWFADGHIGFNLTDYLISFSCADKGHLEKIASVLELSRGMSFDGSCYRLTFSRKSVWSAISEFGGTPAKSLTAKWVLIPESNATAFIRGYVDGDGSLFWHQSGQYLTPAISVCGTPHFLDGLTSTVENLTGIPRPRCVIHNRKVPFVRWTGLQAKCLAVWLYQDASISLDRKRRLSEIFAKWNPQKFGFKRRTVTEKMNGLFSSYLPN
jgi:hypothetical protein